MFDISPAPAAAGFQNACSLPVEFEDRIPGSGVEQSQSFEPATQGVLVIGTQLAPGETVAIDDRPRVRLTPLAVRQLPARRHAFPHYRSLMKQ